MPVAVVGEDMAVQGNSMLVRGVEDREHLGNNHKGNPQLGRVEKGTDQADQVGHDGVKAPGLGPVLGLLGLGEEDISG